MLNNFFKDHRTAGDFSETKPFAKERNRFALIPLEDAHLRRVSGFGSLRSDDSNNGGVPKESGAQGNGFAYVSSERRILILVPLP
jgi:hypothetical protein